MEELKAPQQMSRPGIFSDAKAIRAMAKDQKQAEKRVKGLRRRLVRALENPGVHDPVYKICQRVFHKRDDISLSRENVLRRVIRRNAFKRFLLGDPPRKKNDTSIGDAFNWEWMVHCATQKKTGLVIVTRDSDYGVIFGDKSYINDHLRHEFSERVSRKRKLVLHSRLSEALKLFAVDVSLQEEEAEKELVNAAALRSAASAETPMDFPTYVEVARRSFNEHLKAAGQPNLYNVLYGLVSKSMADSAKTEPVRVNAKTEGEKTSKEFADTKDEGQPGGATHNPRT
jgi:hypothetical protein